MDPAGCAASIAQVVAAIRASGADTVGMQEGTGNACRIADALGWQCSPRLQVISRFPLIDPPGADGLYVYNEVAPGRVMAVANVHLTSDPYGPYFPREGWTLDEILAQEAELRLHEVARHRDGAAGPGRQRHPGGHDRRLQLPVAPGLDGRGQRRPARSRSPTPSTGRSPARWPTPGSATPTATPIPTRSPIRASPGPPATRASARASRSTTASTGSCIPARSRPRPPSSSARPPTRAPTSPSTRGRPTTGRWSRRWPCSRPSRHRSRRRRRGGRSSASPLAVAFNGSGAAGERVGDRARAAAR